MSQYFFEKLATSSLSEAEDIMSTVFKEDPSYWPHGLNKEAMDGGLYLIREASTSRPVGFVGWQDREEDHRKVGYYSIGIKKEHRRKGFAKKAVAEIIRRKAATVDQVKAYIVDTNKPSIGLAEKLDVPILFEKAAMMRNLGGLGAGIAGIGAGGAAGVYAGNQISDTADFLDKNKKLNKILNAATGAAMMAPGLLFAPALRRTKGMVPTLAGMSGAGAIGWPLKEGLVGYKDTQDRFINTQQELVDTNLETAQTEERSAKIQEDTSSIYRNLISKYGTPALVGGGLLGLAAVIAMYKNRSGGGVRGGPGVLSVDIPGEQMSEKFYNSLSRDLLFDSPKEKKRKLQMLLANSGNDPMVQKLLANKSAGFKKKLTNGAGFEKSAGAFGAAVRALAKPVISAGRAVRNAPRAVVDSVKRIPGNLKNTVTQALPQTAKGILGARGGNWAGKAIRNSAITNTGLNVGLMGLDKATGWDTAGTHRDWLFDPFKDAGTNYKAWWNATPEEREKNNYLGRAIGNTLWAPANLVMGAGMGGTVARLGAWAPREAMKWTAKGGKGLLSRFGGQAAVAPGSTNLLTRMGRGIQGAHRGIDRGVMGVINSGQRVGQAAGQGLARSLGMNPHSALGAGTSALGGLTMTSPYELFMPRQAGRFVFENLGRNLRAGGSKSIGNAIANFGKGNNWWNRGLAGRNGAQTLGQRLNPLSFAGGQRLPNAVYQIPHIAGGVAKTLAGAIPSAQLATHMGAPSYHSATGVDPNDPRRMQPSKFTKDFTNWSNSMNDSSIPGTSLLAALPSMLPGMPVPMNYADSAQGGDTVHFGDSKNTGLAGRINPNSASADPALMSFLETHNAHQNLRGDQQLADNNGKILSPEEMNEVGAQLDLVALKYPATPEGFEQWKQDPASHEYFTSDAVLKRYPGITGISRGLMKGMEPLKGLLGMTEHDMSDGFPTEKRRQERTRIWDAWMKRRQKQEALRPVGVGFAGPGNEWKARKFNEFTGQENP